MSRSLVLRKAAEHDIQRAARWYNRQQLGLGIEFSAEVDDLFSRLHDHPERHALVRKDLRRAIVRRFPYAVYYRVKVDRVVVVAVVHTSRRSEAWRRRS